MRILRVCVSLWLLRDSVVQSSFVTVSNGNGGSSSSTSSSIPDTCMTHKETKCWEVGRRNTSKFNPAGLKLYANSAKSTREEEIRRKLIQLKKEGKIGKNKTTSVDYNELIDGSDRVTSVKEDEVKVASISDKAAAKVLKDLATKGNSAASKYEAKIKAKMAERRGLFLDDLEEQNSRIDDEEDKDLESMVAEALMKKKSKIQSAIKDGSLANTDDSDCDQIIVANTTEANLSSTSKFGEDVEMHQPTSSGSWGVFPRPKSISKTFGGGKRVGVGYTKEEDNEQASIDETRAKLQAYREKFGIDVKSEKEHAQEIEEARELGQKMYARGVYNSAVKILEQVTPWCSSNSPVGGRVFLELGMAYEACGRTEEAITVYSTLTQSRMEDIKKDAQRLLYGIEAMDFMRNEVKAKAFQRKKIRDDYIDVSVLSELGGYDEKRYNTAWVDTSNRNGWYYRMLTESVVRSTREARQILLSATYSECNIPRPRVVQALRSISREFDSELRKEMEEAAEPTIFIDGKPIKKKEVVSKEPGSFTLASPAQMIENLDGEWRLQLLADKAGDGVKYFNKTISWQRIDSDNMEYSHYMPVGFANIDDKGEWSFDNESRTFDHSAAGANNDGGWLVSMLGGSTTLKAQQVLTVDDEMCIMRLKTDEKKKNDDSNIKDYFSVWRKVDVGTFSKDR